MSFIWSWIDYVRDLWLSLQYLSPEHNNVLFQRDDLISPNFKNGGGSELTQDWVSELTQKTGGGIWQSLRRTRPRSAFERRHIFVSWNIFFSACAHVIWKVKDNNKNVKRWHILWIISFVGSVPGMIYDYSITTGPTWLMQLWIWWEMLSISSSCNFSHCLR